MLARSTSRVMSSEGVGREAIIRDCTTNVTTNVNGGVSDSCSVMDPSGICVGMYLYKALAHRIHRTRLEWFDLQLGRADPLRFFHRGEVWNVGNALAETG
jgi:hypothetical protein